MGIFSSLVKYVSWAKIASLAMEYGPEIVRQIRQRRQPEEPAGQQPSAEEELNERLTRLEKLLLEQENIIREQAGKNGLLAENCRALESQLSLLKIVTAISLGISLVMLVLLITRW